MIQKVRNVVSKIKALWGFPVFRWVVYQILIIPVVFLIAFVDPNDFDPISDEGYLVVFLSLFFLLPSPAFWVWRKPILKRIRKLISSLNKSAEED